MRLPCLSGGLNGMFKNPETCPQSGNAVFKTISTILAVTTTVLTSLLELVIVFLPGLLSQFFAGN